MKQLKRFFLWTWLLQKRLLKKTSFLIILAIVPVAVLMLQFFVSGSDHSIISIAVVQEDDDGELLDDVFQRLLDSDVIRYELMTEEDAMDALEQKSKDAVWIIPEHFTKELRNMIHKGFKERDAFIEVRQREEDVFLQMSRMQLFGSLYQEISYELFRAYMVDTLEVGESVSEEMMQELYEKNHVQGQLFRYAFSDVNGEEDKLDILTVPMRPFLALWLVLCGLVGGLYWKLDLQKGTFDQFMEKKKPLLGFGCQLLVVLDGAVVIWLTVILAHIGQEIAWEALITLLYAVNTVLFCNLLHGLVPSANWYATLGGLLLLVMAVVCPLFVTSASLMQFSYLFPVHYYIRAIHSPLVAGMGLTYLVVLVLLNILIFQISMRKKA